MSLLDLRQLEKLDVYDDTRFAGTLHRTKRGAEFTYDAKYRDEELSRNGIGIAFNLSPQQETHIAAGTNLHTFFAGLLPEGLRLKALRTLVKTSEDDLFTMLAALGSNCIGNVFVRSGIEEERTKIDVQSPGEVSFLELFEQSIYDPSSAQRDRDPGVPGVMPKISASMVSFPISLKNRPKQYLLKLGTPEHPHLIENEHFFMQVAADCGIRVAATSIVHDRDNKAGLLVERFDRRFDPAAKSTRRLHQEDACQFLDRYPQDKYRVSMREICEAVSRLSSTPLLDIRGILEMYVFSYLIGNGDLHAKNISLLRTFQSGEVELSPAYDLLSTLPYGDRKMALRMNGRDDEFTKKDFIAFGEMFGVRERAVRSMIDKLATRISTWIPRLDDAGFQSKKARDIAKTFQDRVSKVG